MELSAQRNFKEKQIEKAAEVRPGEKSKLCQLILLAIMYAILHVQRDNLLLIYRRVKFSGCETSFI